MPPASTAFTAWQAIRAAWLGPQLGLIAQSGIDVLAGENISCGPAMLPFSLDQSLLSVCQRNPDVGTPGGPFSICCRSCVGLTPTNVGALCSLFWPLGAEKWRRSQSQRWDGWRPEAHRQQRSRSLHRKTGTIAPLWKSSSKTDWDRDGNDGPWSTFTVQIGTPPQSVRLLISTASAQTWAVAAEGCGSGDPTNCVQSRGGRYDYNASSSWVPNLASASNQIYFLTLESNLGYDGKGRYGFDDITLGFQGEGGRA